MTLSLALGLGLGILLASGWLATPLAQRIAYAIEPVGTVWVNAIRMTIIPLVVSMLIVGVAGSGDTRRTGRLGLLSFATFVCMLIVLATATALVAPSIFHYMVLDPVSTASLRAQAHVSLPSDADFSFRSWLVSVVPINPVKAAADGALLPVVVFTLVYAFALAQTVPETRTSQVQFFRGISEVMLLVVHRVLALAPIGVFALALVLGFQLRGSAIAALGFYVGLSVAMYGAATILLYPLAIVGGRVPLRRFANAVLPAQTVAFSSRSSLASLPALVEGARDRLKLPSAVTAFVLPLSVSVFKLGPTILWTVGALFIAHLYGLHLGTAQVLTVAVASVVLSGSTPGIPSGGLLVQAPVFAMLGLPIEGLGILIAVDAILDMFRTTLNVTGDMVVATLLSRADSTGQSD